jgi:hypothetical protein
MLPPKRKARDNYLLCAFRHPQNNGVALLDVDIEQRIGVGIGKMLNWKNNVCQPGVERRPNL